MIAHLIDVLGQYDAPILLVAALVAFVVVVVRIARQRRAAGR